eukprot:865528-Heterocapsa_arctica.AAC.1
MVPLLRASLRTSLLSSRVRRPSASGVPESKAAAWARVTSAGWGSWDATCSQSSRSGGRERHPELSAPGGRSHSSGPPPLGSRRRMRIVAAWPASRRGLGVGIVPGAPCPRWGHASASGAGVPEAGGGPGGPRGGSPAEAA